MKAYLHDQRGHFTPGGPGAFTSRSGKGGSSGGDGGGSKNLVGCDSSVSKTADLLFFVTAGY